MITLALISLPLNGLPVEHVASLVVLSSSPVTDKCIIRIMFSQNMGLLEMIYADFSLRFPHLNLVFLAGETIRLNGKINTWDWETILWYMNPFGRRFP